MEDWPRYYDRDGEPMSVEEWRDAFGEDRHVARDEIEEFWISTVWLGLDHSYLGLGPPLIFETMVFGPDSYRDRYCDRYPTEAAALAGHDQAIAWVRDHLDELRRREDDEDDDEEEGA